MPEAVVGQLVAGTAAIGYCEDETAVAQAGKVVRQPGARDAQCIGKVGGVGRGFAQGEQDAAADRIGERAAEPDLSPRMTLFCLCMGVGAAAGR
ncbi:hypothetical protein ADL12_20290 [Streptomyces regalis]|uniref:Uncharacterized protein n=1 Tax=Streptomyces regalis TaxID=68262 RepID=A0A0X3UR47_9ACTN|nr:hypothetical protein ADL12_20290 [Streptomyces regalis]